MSDIERVADGLLVSLGPHESSLLRELLAEMKTLLKADIPDVDPVKTRLFPAAFEDPANEEHYRHLTGDELHEAKVAALSEVQSSLEADPAFERVLRDEEVSSWLTVITDLRLAIGTRLDVTEQKMAAEIDPSHPDAAAYAVLHWLGWLQESFLEAM